ncbi:hypothetical protein [Desulfobacula sp.]|uniref:hypothetical protein n=1 Tax=Desulfobacula sp. TaxID=2593537 RepID=UPI00260D7876|nr:hypothetical protein [Desulfobacula sp.]
MISLDDFVVLRKLSVKHIQVDPKRVKAEYCVETFSGEMSSYELMYSYETAYFNGKNAEDVNLASMMLAQVALNYGLFFETIELDGLYDKADKKFLANMLENTSREIVTNKLLIKNEFLQPPYNTLKPEKRSKYTRSDLIFSNTRFSGLTLERPYEKTDPDKYAILSSGGKDSLLSYGIINEIGEAFPVFINESGRHWFTAVNTYKYFKEIEPNTHKPWCNSDRVFNWMLRQLPFIRKNYAGIRSDIYPIRLWTVAVFLFGVLPIARKKGIGNVLIGNEYDTTLKGSISGILHYSGLYDQSKYFDMAMTRYYRAKGWQINQFSILRSLSELLIMKILSRRYPKLQQHQVSCHAAHKAGERMIPCGKCEKCRRIIGMLRALDENPERCGYTGPQIAEGLAALERQSVKQIGSDVSHLYHLLVSKKLIRQNDHTKRLAKEHAEITKLRLDKERSNLADMPLYIRKPLFDILYEYSDGAVLRTDHQWKEIQLDDAFLNAVPYKMDE